MAFSRLDLVKRLINENPTGIPTVDGQLDGDDVFRRRLWNDLNSFVNVSKLGFLEFFKDILKGFILVQVALDLLIDFFL